MSESDPNLSETPSDSCSSELDDELSWTHYHTCREARESLKGAEAAVLGHVHTEYRMKYVNVGPVIGTKDVFIWTWYSSKVTENNDIIPIVLVHGLGSGLAFWVKNLDALAYKFPVIALDLPGFGRSSRPVFSKNPAEAEHQFVAVIEKWREKMGLEKMIVVGFSFGGFLTFAYGLAHPERVSQLICVDPWGFKARPEHHSECKYGFLMTCSLKVVYNLPVNVYDILRLTGPKLLKWTREDLIKSFSDYVPDAADTISNYDYYVNTLDPTGEVAFKTLSLDVAWAKNPMILRMPDLDKSVPLTLIYATHSMIDHYPIEKIINMRKPGVTYFYLIDASHHLYASNSAEFNNIILEVASGIARAAESEAITSANAQLNSLDDVLTQEP